MSEPEASRRGEAIVPLVIGLGPFVSYLDASLANALFPSVLDHFGRDVSITSWVVNAANLSLTTGLVISGAVADTHGRRRMFGVGLQATALFAAGAALAPNLGSLIACRIGIGFAGALLLASSLALVSSAVRPERQAAAVGIYAAIGGLGSLVGPLLGAAAAAWLSWRWGLAALIPISLLGAWLGQRSLPPDTERRPTRVNYAAGIAAGLCLAGVLFALGNGASRGWLSPVVTFAWTVALVLAGALLFLELRSTRPLFPHQLRSRPYVRSLVGISGLGIVLGASLLAIPLFVTEVLGRSHATASLTLVPAAILAVPAAIASGRMASRFGYAMPSGLGLLLAVLSPLALALLGPNSGLGMAVAISAFSGIGIGMGIPAMAGSALAAARQADAGSGSGWYHSVRVLGIAIGVLAFATLASTGRSAGPGPTTARVSEEASEALDRVLACERMDCVEQRFGSTSSSIPSDVAATVRTEMRGKFAASYRRAFLWCAALASLSLLVWIALRSEARRGPTYVRDELEPAAE
jgi:MFS family permease